MYTYYKDWRERKREREREREREKKKKKLPQPTDNNRYTTNNPIQPSLHKCFLLNYMTKTHCEAHTWRLNGLHQYDILDLHDEQQKILNYCKLERDHCIKILFQMTTIKLKRFGTLTTALNITFLWLKICDMIYLILFSDILFHGFYVAIVVV